ncbi:MAG: terminase small subunit [Desulfuromonadaceae bacterium]|nr:terminase small subunit [Desulfuromonadaceae bacterium]MDD5104869.1 terminase small subunit [Desulfuromonadaceae bacterium]
MSSIPGQATLPALESELGYGAITHLKPQAEAFCWQYVLSASNAKDAYLKSYPGSSETSALANSSRLMKTKKVQQRLTEIRTELQHRYAVDAQSILRLLTMTAGVDRRQFVAEDGRPLELHELPPEAAAIVDIEIVMDRHGKKHAIAQVPERLKAAVELAKIIGLSKEKLEVSGTIERTTLNIYVPDNGRDSRDAIQEQYMTRFKKST